MADSWSMIHKILLNHKINIYNWGTYSDDDDDNDDCGGGGHDCDDEQDFFVWCVQY
jgi:hypothetical protein